MATYGFYERYVPGIKAGTKDQTIRRIRKYPPQVGETLRLKCKQKLFGTARITEVFQIKFNPKTNSISGPKKSTMDLHSDQFARRDGFSTPAELFKELRKYSTDKTDWNEFLVIRWENFKEISQETLQLFKTQ